MEGAGCRVQGAGCSVEGGGLTAWGPWPRRIPRGQQCLAPPIASRSRIPSLLGVPGVEREFFTDNLLVRIHFIIVMIRRTGLAPWEFEFPFPGSLTSTFLDKTHVYHLRTLGDFPPLQVRGLWPGFLVGALPPTRSLRVSFPHNSGGYVNKCAPHKSLKLTSSCKLSFDERFELHRVVAKAYRSQRRWLNHPDFRLSTYAPPPAPLPCTTRPQGWTKSMIFDFRLRGWLRRIRLCQTRTGSNSRPGFGATLGASGPLQKCKVTR